MPDSPIWFFQSCHSREGAESLLPAVKGFGDLAAELDVVAQFQAELFWFSVNWTNPRYS